ncbi:MAG: response regulator transcription factor [Candidatus Improbicoccus pseudotrichonymphae]|uniref:Stage 0 sporulation protein A homolog n=1 Tax=Candidatus Improbicoccus pseudotrichonymphae TaxID=3033792 RepID=A0AA48IGZ2_9FIRM|nr:MAG: response regulator transcription factor [Candidatus Improbicoccus pseudotrichonymphae]
MKRILVVEDEDAIREFEIINLQRAGYQVIETSNGNEALSIFEEKNGDFDLAVIDIMISGIDGIELCKELRKRSKSIGIILLTAKTQEMDKISGLMYGADDYITKPFSPSELIARVDALYRRVALITSRINNNFNEEIKFNEFSLNLRKRTLKKNDKNISLTQVEFQIIEYLFSNPNSMLSRKQILDYVWKESNENFDEKIVDVNIRRLRMKIEDNPSSPKHIITIWGVGYKWQ